MSWAGVLDRVQVETAILLSKPVDCAKIERKYLLSLSTLLDEPAAEQIVGNRVDAGYCANWLCDLTLLPAVVMNEEQHAAAAAAAASSVGNSPAFENQQSTKKNSTTTSIKRCCSDRCEATLRVLLNRAHSFDPSSPDVTQALFKIFPRAEENINRVLASHQQQDDVPAAGGQPQFKVVEKVGGRGDVSEGGGGGGGVGVVGASAASSLLFAALDPRVAVLVVCDVMLPPELKLHWTRLAAANARCPSSKEMQLAWLEPLNMQSIIDEVASSGCSSGHHDTNAEAVEVNSTSSLSDLIVSNRKASLSSVDAATTRSRVTAFDLLSNLVVQESRRAALLLRLESELPTELRLKLDELMCVMKIPTPIPYEDSPDTWLLFVLLLYVVFAVTDEKFARVFAQVPKRSLSVDVFDAFCITPVQLKEMISNFFAI